MSGFWIAFASGLVGAFIMFVAIVAFCAWEERQYSDGDDCPCCDGSGEFRR